MAKKNFGNLVDNAKEEIAHRQIERESVHQLQKQISQLEEQMEKQNQLIEEQSQAATEPEPEAAPAPDNQPEAEEEVKKTFRIYAHLNTAFNIAAAKRGIGKGALLNQLIEQWLKDNGEL